MAYRPPYRMGGGLNTKADATSIADGQLTRARGCSFDLVGAVGSARGRTRLATVVAATSILGHFDAERSGTKYRFTKVGASIYEDFTTDTGAVFGAATYLSGFGYNGYIYLCDGSNQKRWDGTTLAPWGLDPPGYLDLADNPITTAASTTVTVAATAHGLSVNSRVEIRGALSVGGIPAEEINKVQTVASVPDANSFTFTSTTTGSVATGGGTFVTIARGPKLAASGSGGTTSAGFYGYAYTLYNGVAESNFSATTVQELTAGQQADLSEIIAGGTGVTARRVYRTDVAESAVAAQAATLYFLTELTDNTTTTYTDKHRLPSGALDGTVAGADPNSAARPLTEAAEIGQQRKTAVRQFGLTRWQQERTSQKDSGRREAPEVVMTNLGMLSDWNDHDPPPADLKHVFVLQEQVFGMSGSSVVFSLTGQPEHWPVYNAFKPGRNSSESLVSIAPLDRDCICYTNSGLYRFSAVGLSFEDPRLETIDSPVGLAGEWAVARLEGLQAHVFLSHDGLYLFDGTRVTEVVLELEGLFTDSTHEDAVNSTYSDTAWAVASRDRLFLSYGSDADNDRLLIVDFQSPQEPKATIIPWSLTCLSLERNGNVLIGGDADGRVYQLDTTYADNGGDIEWSITSKEFVLSGADGAAVRLDELILDANFAGAITTVTVTCRARGNTLTTSFTSTASGRQRIKTKLPVWLVGETAQVTVSSSHDGARYLYGLGFTLIGEDEP